MAATWGWWLYSFGPAMVLLRDEQGTSRAVASLHGTLLAVGALLAGVLAAPMVQWFGRRRLLAMGCAGIAGGVVLLVTGPGLAFTLLAALVIGTFGSMAFNMTTPVLTAAHRETAPAAISEANAVAATVGLLAPLGLGAAVVVGWGWRAAAAVSAATALLTVAAVVRAGSSPAWSTRPVTRAAGRTPFTLPFWAIWVALVACIGVEFASTFWAADLLMTEHGMPPGRAAAAVAALVGGMAAGRWVAAWAARRWAAAPMLTVALIVAGVGWLVMWVAPGPVTAVCGLALLGLGMSWHFPMTITLLIKAAGPGRTDSAAGLASVGAGIASGGAPFLLGALADRVGPHSAFGVVPVLLLAALVGLRVATRAD
ncbi:MAG TPA: MFS transporter [Actinomycetales bacterium]|nr:MFS transporter [Actinomycetales bacterium]